MRAAQGMRRYSLQRGALRAGLGAGPGDVVAGFRVERRERVAEKHLDCMLLRHEATGARHLHVDCADSNNTFAVAFLTVPAGRKELPIEA